MDQRNVKQDLQRHQVDFRAIAAAQLHHINMSYHKIRQTLTPNTTAPCHFDFTEFRYKLNLNNTKTFLKR